MRQSTRRKARIGGLWSRGMLIGPQGSGKTLTALMLARSLDDGRGIVVVDTEKEGPDTWSSELYAAEFGHEVEGWDPPYSPIELAEYILTEGRNASVIIVDSSSHFWQNDGGTLSVRDKAAVERFRGNQWAAWSEARPVQEQLVHAVTHAPCHLIFCSRAKVSWEVVNNVPRAVGTEAKQDPEIEHEFTWTAGMTQGDHRLVIRKSRMQGVMQAEDSFGPGDEQERLFTAMAEWTRQAEAASPVVTPDEARELLAGINAFKGAERSRIKSAFLERFKVRPDRLQVDQLEAARAWLELGGRDPEPEQDDDPEGWDDDDPWGESEAEPARIGSVLKDDDQPETVKKAAKKSTKKAAKKTTKKSAKKATKRAEASPGDHQVRGAASDLVQRLVMMEPDAAEEARDALDDAGIQVDKNLTGDRLEEAWSIVEQCSMVGQG